MAAVLERSTTELEQTVREALASHAALAGTDVHADVSNGTVTLTGTADCYARKVTAQQVAHRVPGVREVINLIEIPVSGFYGWRDVDLFEGAQRALASHYLFSKHPVDVAVDKGWIRLRGKVGSEFERAEAEHAISTLPNLRGIRNDLRVVAPSSH